MAFKFKAVTEIEESYSNTPPVSSRTPSSREEPGAEETVRQGEEEATSEVNEEDTPSDHESEIDQD